MDFVSIRIITDDVARLVGFYEQVTGVPARWGNETSPSCATPAGTLAIGSTRTVALFGAGAARAGRQPHARSSSSSSTTSTPTTRGCGTRRRPS